MKKNKKTDALNYFGKKGLSIRLIETKDNEGRITEKKADKTRLRRVCSDEEIKKIESDFDKFFKVVYDNCLDDESKEKLLFLKEDIKQNYFIYMCLLIDFSPARPIVNVDRFTRTVDLFEPDVKTKEKLISMASRHLFFLADIVIAFVIGDNKILNKILTRNEEMTGKKLSDEKKKVLIKIVNNRNELKGKEKTIRKFSWKYVIAITYLKLTIQEKKLLLFNDKDSELDVSSRLNDKQIKSISETIRYHQNEGNL